MLYNLSTVRCEKPGLWSTPKGWLVAATARQGAARESRDRGRNSDLGNFWGIGNDAKGRPVAALLAHPTRSLDRFGMSAKDRKRKFEFTRQPGEIALRNCRDMIPIARFVVGGSRMTAEIVRSVSCPPVPMSRGNGRCPWAGQNRTLNALKSQQLWTKMTTPGARTPALGRRREDSAPQGGGQKPCLRPRGGLRAHSSPGWSGRTLTATRW